MAVCFTRAIPRKQYSEKCADTFSKKPCEAQPALPVGS